MKRFIPLVFVLTLLSLTAIQPAFAQKVTWQTSGIGLATSSNTEYMNYSWSTLPTMKNTNITDDGTGGVIMCWMANVSGYYYIYAQRADATGALIWTTSANGIKVASPTGGYSYAYQYRPSCVGDGSGGAYIAWIGQDYANGSRYHQFIQHIDATGNQLWGSSGYSLSPATEYASTSYPYIPQLDKDGSGGCVVSYYTYASSSIYGSVRAARVTGNASTPTFLWGGSALTIQTFSSGGEYMFSSVNPVICSDNAGGAFLAYHTYNSPKYTNHVVKISPSGTVVYNTSATAISSYPSYGYYGYNIVPDGSGGAILDWLQSTDPNTYVSYCQKAIDVNSSGGIKWGGTSGILTHGSNEYYQYPGGRMASDNSGGTYILRYDNWNSSSPCLQRVDNNGNLVWNPYSYTTGIVITNNSQYYTYVQNAQVISDKYGNAITVYTYGNTVYIQKWDKNTGNAMWGSTMTSFGSGLNAELTDDGIGGAFVGWNQTSSGYDIYAQHVVDTAMAPHSRLTGATTINVGNVRVGGTFAINSVSLSNYIGSNFSQQFPLSVTGATSASGQATLTSPASFPAVVNVGSTIPMSIRVAPKQNGPFTETLLINTNDPLKPQQKITINGVGVYPHLTSSDTMNMPGSHVGAPYIRTFAINNTGTDVLNLTSATFTTGDASNFNVVSGAPQSIAAGSSGNITVSFTPSSASPKVTTFNIFSDDSVSPKQIQVSGRGIFPHLTAASNTVAFPFTVVDVRTSQRSLIVTNTGTENLIIKPATNVAGANAADFSVVNTALPMTIAPQATGQINLQFAPKINLGVRNATLNVVSNFDSINPFPITLSGTSVDGAPFLTFSQLINAGKIHVGKIDTVIFRITNTVDATKKGIISQYVITGANAANFTILNPPSVPDTLNIPGSRDLQIRFVANHEGLSTAQLHMMTNADAIPIDIPILGTGAKAVLNVQPIDFGKVAINGCKDLQLQITNFGSDVLNISSFNISGLSSQAYTVQGSTNLILLPGASNSIKIRFCPTAVGNADVTARFITSDLDTVYVGISGRGANAGNLSAQTAFDFGLVAINQSLSRPLHISNTGDIPVTITAVRFTNGTVPVPFSTDLAVPITVKPGEAIDANLMFSSNTGGVKTATIVFTSDDNHSLSITLRGNATPDQFAADPPVVADTIFTLGQHLQNVFTLKNFTKNPKGIAGLRITGPGAGAYRIVYPLQWPYQVNGLGTDSIVVGFYPTAPGTYLATLEVYLLTASAGAADTVRIALGNVMKSPTAVLNGATPMSFDLSQNHPNPFTNTTQLTYTLATRAPVTLTVYDIVGRVVRELVNGTRDAGVYSLDVSAEGLPAGLYSYELRVNGATQSRLMQVVR